MLLSVDALNIRLTAILKATCGHEDMNNTREDLPDSPLLSLNFVKREILARFHV